jgi:hypothetical protein
MTVETLHPPVSSDAAPLYINQQSGNREVKLLLEMCGNATASDSNGMTNINQVGE